MSAKNDADLAACATQACVQTHRDALLQASAISRDVMWDIANARADERLIQELLGRQNRATSLQYVQRRVEHIERANVEMAQYVQAHCQGLSQTACTTKLQQSQDTAGAFTEIVAGFTPAGIAIDIKDLLQAQTLGEYSLAVLGAVLPGLGDGFKAAIKGAEATKGLSRGVENIASFNTLNEARAAARQFSTLGDDATNFVQEIGPFKGQVTGRMSADGLRGWRIDFDPSKGFHINWWDRSAGPSRSDWLYGANKIEGGTLDKFLMTLQHFPGN